MDSYITVKSFKNWVSACDRGGENWQHLDQNNFLIDCLLVTTIDYENYLEIEPQIKY